MTRKRQIRKNDRKHFNVHEMALFLNMTPRRIQQLTEKGILRRVIRGKYELIPNLHGYINHLRGLVSFYAGHNNTQKYPSPATESLTLWDEPETSERTDNLKLQMALEKAHAEAKRALPEQPQLPATITLTDPHTDADVNIDPALLDQLIAETSEVEKPEPETDLTFLDDILRDLGKGHNSGHNPGTCPPQSPVN